jgi:hypothetical protein
METRWVDGWAATRRANHPSARPLNEHDDDFLERRTRFPLAPDLSTAAWARLAKACALSQQSASRVM